MPHRDLNYANRIRERGYRLTPQRELVLDAVCEGGGHTTFDEIYRRVRERAPAVNRATVYRALDFLCQLHLVVSAEIAGRTVYEIAGREPHHHLICRSCGRMEQINHAAVRDLIEHIERRYRFRVEVNHLVLPGLSHRCRPAASPSPSSEETTRE